MNPKCVVCRDNDVLIDRTAGTWDVCSCAAGDQVTADIREGEADIEAGRFHRWSEVRRSFIEEDLSAPLGEE